MPRKAKAQPSVAKTETKPAVKHIPIEDIPPAGGWVATPENDPLNAGKHPLPSESTLEEVVVEEYREDDPPPVPEEENEEEAPPAEELVAAPVTFPPPPVSMAPIVGDHQFPAPPLTGQSHPIFGNRLGPAEFVGEYEDGSPEWHAARTKGIGGSDAACILNIGFNSAHKLWLIKKGYLSPDRLEDNERLAEILEWGHLQEPALAEKFTRRNPRWKVIEGGSWRKADAPWMLANPDGILLDEETGEVAILEMKTSESGTGYEEGRIPSKYVVQIRHYMWVFGVSYGYLVVKVGNSDYREYYVPADVTKDIIRVFSRDNRKPVHTTCHYGDGATLEATEYNFIMAEEPPAMSGHEDIYQIVRQKNLSLERNTEVEIPIEIATAWFEAKAEMAAAEEKLGWAKNHIMAQLGTKHHAMYNGEKIASRVAKGDNPPYLLAK